MKAKDYRAMQDELETKGWKFTMLMSGNGWIVSRGNTKIKGESLEEIIDRL